MEQLSNAQAQALGGKYLMATYARAPLALTRGQGARVWDADGKSYLDFVSGIAVNALGHSPDEVVAALVRQAQTLIHCSNLYWNLPQIELARLLVENSAFAKVFFANSGAEANEGAIKLARRFAALRLNNDSGDIICMEQSFHGRTLATLAASGQDKLHQGVGPLPSGFKHVPFNDLARLEASIDANTCAVLLEPVQGEGGVHVADPDYLRAVRRLCDRHNLLLIFDEIQVGLGRTGSLFAHQHYGVEPDIITLAKALGGGLPLGAILAKEEVAAVFDPGSHGSTFGGNPVACASAHANLEAILRPEVGRNVRDMAIYLREHLEGLVRQSALAVEARGLGLIQALELTVDAEPVIAAAREKGLLIHSAGAKVLRWLPPLNVSAAEIDAAAAIVGRILQEQEPLS